MDEKIISVRGGMFSTMLRIGGSGEPLLYLHSIQGLYGQEAFLAELTRTFTVYAPSHPGFEASVGLDHIDDVIDLTVYYNDFLDALGLETVHMLGHSLGGMIAAELAALTPHRVRKLVLVSPMGLWLDDQPIVDLFALTPAQLRGILWNDPDCETAKAMYAVAETSQAQLEDYLRRMQHLATAGKFLWPIPDKGLKKRIHRIKAPTHIVWGQSDRLMPPSYGLAFQRHIANSTLSVLDYCGHMPMYEDLNGFNRTVSAFLQG